MNQNILIQTQDQTTMTLLGRLGLASKLVWTQITLTKRKLASLSPNEAMMWKNGLKIRIQNLNLMTTRQLP